MNLLIESQATPYRKDLNKLTQILEHLSNTGFEPLITKAKQKFVEVFVSLSQMSNLMKEPFSVEAMFEYTYRNRRLPPQYREDFRVPIGGDLFYSNDGNSILYLAFMVSDPTTIRKRLKDLQVNFLEIGFIGDEAEKIILETMKQVVSEFISKSGEETAWSPIQPTCPLFEELRQGQENKFVLANSIGEPELQLAQLLEDSSIRNLAIVIKRSGGILESDLIKKSAIKPEQLESIIGHLSQNNLIAKEYVVICNKTSSQINRVDSKEKIEKMTEMGVLCSCGNPIGKERIEKLISPTPTLQKMLDGSYWMTARIVKLLKQLNIPDEHILLNLQEGAEEIDAFVNVDGNLLMFELKDNEFSMGHAYPFGGRIGLYKPYIAIIVSTKGIAPEVREYFKRVKPAVQEIVYVGNLNEFDDNLQTVVTQIRSRRVVELISQFESMANIRVPIAQMIATKLGIEKTISRHIMEDEYTIKF